MTNIHTGVCSQTALQEFCAREDHDGGEVVVGGGAGGEGSRLGGHGEGLCGGWDFGLARVCFGVLTAEYDPRYYAWGVWDIVRRVTVTVSESDTC